MAGKDGDRLPQFRVSLTGKVVGSCMIDWEHLAQRQVAEIQRGLAESIRVRAMDGRCFLALPETRKAARV